MFADRHRVAVISLSGLLLLALCGAYARGAVTSPDGVRACREEPLQHDGDPLVLALYEVTAIPGPGRFELSKVYRDIPVLSEEPVALHETVSVAGVFRAEGQVIVAERVVHHPLRRAKGALSALGLLCALGAAPFAFRWRAGWLEPRDA